MTEQLNPTVSDETQEPAVLDMTAAATDAPKAAPVAPAPKVLVAAEIDQVWESNRVGRGTAVKAQYWVDKAEGDAITIKDLALPSYSRVVTLGNLNARYALVGTIDRAEMEKQHAAEIAAAKEARAAAKQAQLPLEATPAPEASAA